MLTRSETPLPIDEEEPAESSSRGRPLLLALLAGLLAIVGAFLLVQALDPAEDAAVADVPVEQTKQVLVVTQTIPAGTDVADILADARSYLVARSIPEDYVPATAISSIAELEQNDGLILASDAIAGEQLLADRFVERDTFEADSFLDRNAAVAAPDGHHTVVLTLDAQRALNGNIRPGERVAVISAFRIEPPEEKAFEISMVVLPAVEVVYVESSEGIGNEVARDADVLGQSISGTISVTLAVEPTEVTDLAFAMEYGKIILAGSLDGASNQEPRHLSTIRSVVDGTNLVVASDEDVMSLNELVPFPGSTESNEASGTNPLASNNGSASTETDENS